jgi:predicted aminopeptidase
MRRIPIEAAIEDTALSQERRNALQWVSAAHDFAITRKLDCAGSFESFSPLDEEALSWIVAAARPLELTAKEWWFPIVGHVPYQGFFEKPAAITAAKQLQQEGYQTVVRPVTAFSTLGWFSDPVLTPLLRRPPLEIVNTVIHECVHSTMWVPDNVQFNESVAHFVALNETVLFFSSGSYPAAINDVNAYAGHAHEAQETVEREFLYAQALTALRKQLVEIFSNHALTPEQMTEKKRLAYENALSPIFGGKNRIGENNAALLQELAYHNYFACFLPKRKNYADSPLPELINRLKECLVEEPTT